MQHAVFSFEYYRERIRKSRHFEVGLDGTWGDPSLEEAALNDVLHNWLAPLVDVASNIFILRADWGDDSDCTPSPRTKQPRTIRRAKDLLEVRSQEANISLQEKYWRWALRHRIVIFKVAPERFPINSLAKECWDPVLVTNLGVILGANGLGFAKFHAFRGKAIVCSATWTSSGFMASLLAPDSDLLALYEACVLNCRFMRKGLEEELMPYRRKMLRQFRTAATNPKIKATRSRKRTMAG